MNQPHRTQTQQRHRQQDALVLSHASANPAEISRGLARAAEHAHLVSPATAVAVLPEGCQVVLSTVLLDVARETYDVGGGKLGLSKVALDRISAGAGISWDPSQSGRTDDGSDPYYCAWRAVGTLRQLDGTEITIEGNKEMDLRDGSPQIQAMWERFEASKRSARNGGKQPKDPTAQIREMRLHIMGHAESKARLRAVRSIGIRTSYERDELDKPFVVARLMFTGESADPAIRAEFARMTAQAMLGGRRALFGDQHAAPAPRVIHAAPSLAAPSLTRMAPPPVGTSRDEDDDEFAPAPAPSREPMRGQSTPSRAQPARDEGAERPSSGLTIPGGNEKGVAIEAASDRSLEYWEDRISRSLEEGGSRYPDKDQALVDAMRAEIAARGNGGGQ